MEMEKDITDFIKIVDMNRKVINKIDCFCSDVNKYSKIFSYQNKNKSSFFHNKNKQMSKQIKQKSEAKKILKQKLINYQNELRQQADILIYDGFITSGSDQFGLMTLSKNSLEFSPTKPKKYPQSNYQHYLNSQLYEEDFVVGKKSLTRENILAINKKSKIMKSNLKELAKKRTSSIDTGFVPYASMESSPSITPQNVQKSISSEFKQLDEKGLGNLLVIKQSVKQQTVSPSNTIRKSVSHQSTRPRPKSTIHIKPYSAHPQTRTLSTLNPQTPTPPHLTEYYTPCYHKQTTTGYIVQDFQPKIRTKHFQDNLKIMAKLIKKKVSCLEREQIVKYLKNIGQRKVVERGQDGKIQALVRENNWLSQRNIMESKLVKGGKVQNSKKSNHKFSDKKN